MRWRSLTPRQQWVVAERVARTRGASLRRRITGFVSIGPGFRTRGAGELTAEVVLRVLVRRKWMRDRDQRGRVPPTIRAYLRRGDKKLVVAIPTDVFTAPPMSAQAAESPQGGIRVRWPSAGSPLIGAACCLVHDDSATYLMSCHHLLTGSLTHAGCGARAGCVAYAGPGDVRIGPVVDWTQLTPAGRSGSDVALALVEDADAAHAAIGESQCRQILAGSPIPRSYSILAPRGVLAARFRSYQYHLTLPYQCGAHVRIDRAIESEAATRGGDSGSPLVALDLASGEQVLIGMHFYGDGAETSLSLDSGTLFDPRLFKRWLQLA